MSECKKEQLLKSQLSLLLLFFFFSLNERVPSANETLKNLYIDRSFSISTKENIAMSLDEERRVLPPRRLPPIPEDKLHRVNH